MRLPPGLAFLDHTADVGIAVTAPSLDALFHRAAQGMVALLRGLEDDLEAGDPGESGEPGSSQTSSTTIELEATGMAGLLAAWLRELLFLHETGHRDYVAAEFERLDAAALRARVETAPATGAVREIKGVTYHELVVEPTADGWKGQVIFDV